MQRDATIATLMGALKMAQDMLTQPVQFSGIKTEATCDILRADCALVAKLINATLEKVRA